MTIHVMHILHLNSDLGLKSMKKNTDIFHQIKLQVTNQIKQMCAHTF